MRAPLFVDADIRILKMREHVCIVKRIIRLTLNISMSTTVCVAYISIIDYLCDIS